MNFVSPGFLWALLAVAVPLLIHLLLRDRIQRVLFPAVLSGASPLRLRLPPGLGRASQASAGLGLRDGIGCADCLPSPALGARPIALRRGPGSGGVL
jgi:hypothetical protein